MKSSALASTASENASFPSPFTAENPTVCKFYKIPQAQGRGDELDWMSNAGRIPVQLKIPQGLPSTVPTSKATPNYNDSLNKSETKMQNQSSKQDDTRYVIRFTQTIEYYLSFTIWIFNLTVSPGPLHKIYFNIQPGNWVNVILLKTHLKEPFCHTIQGKRYRFVSFQPFKVLHFWPI